MDEYVFMKFTTDENGHHYIYPPIYLKLISLLPSTYRFPSILTKYTFIPNSITYFLACKLLNGNYQCCQLLLSIKEPRFWFWFFNKKTGGSLDVGLSLVFLILKPLKFWFWHTFSNLRTSLGLVQNWVCRHYTLLYIKCCMDRNLYIKLKLGSI
jgi:hypothetical protein